MFTRSGGMSSPRLSRSLLVAQISLVSGCTARPTELRRPREYACALVPSGRYEVTAARVELDSSQILQLDPTDRYSVSPRNTMVRVLCPLVGMFGMITSGAEVGVANRTTWLCSATYSVSPRN